MRKILFAIVAAALVSTQAMAQDEKSEHRRERKFDKTEMVKHRTDETVSRYKLNDKQAKKLLELNQVCRQDGPTRSPSRWSFRPSRRWSSTHATI